MSRTYGAIDRKPRKKRSDAGKRRKTYRGKPTKKKRKKNGKFVPYVSKRKRDDPVKLWFWREDMMSKDGYRRFSRSTRMYMRKRVYGRGGGRVRIDVDPYQISTKELVEQLAVEFLWEGTWFMKMWSHARNKYHCTARTVAVIKITDHPEGLRAKMIENRRLFRYWFFNKV